MAQKQMLFKLMTATDLRKGGKGPVRWAFHGEGIEGTPVTLMTAKIGRNEQRWFPKQIMGETLRISFHETQSGKLVADLWRRSSDEGEDLAALFAKERTLYLVEQERQALIEAVMEVSERPRTTSRL